MNKQVQSNVEKIFGRRWGLGTEGIDIKRAEKSSVVVVVDQPFKTIANLAQTEYGKPGARKELSKGSSRAFWKFDNRARVLVTSLGESRTRVIFTAAH